jgi:hypothetical protein
MNDWRAVSVGRRSSAQDMCGFGIETHAPPGRYVRVPAALFQFTMHAPISTQHHNAAM